MRRLFAILVVATAPYGLVAESDALHVTGDETKAWAGKTVVPTARSVDAYTFTRASDSLM